MSHNHQCDVCKQVVAHCEGECQHPDPQFCTMHHPDPQFKVEDKPTVRMTVRVDNSEVK